VVRRKHRQICFPSTDPLPHPQSPRTKLFLINQIIDLFS